MLINKIRLNNIRSYKDQEINLSKGSTLLSGNIGSGKSTIFLAIDFALFGISRDLPGSALLRNGEREGSVELEFKIGDDTYSIKRGLKRTATSISQDTGHLIVNGEKNEMTAIELKQKIIETLNYPQELLTKSKSMIYHYTVYTPQEKMKDILLSKKEDRLNILRKVFGIDKYQRVRNNTETFVTCLKQKTKELAASVADFEQRSEELSERREKQSELEIVIKDLLPRITVLQGEISLKKEKVDVLEQKLKESTRIKHEIEKNRLLLVHKKQEITNVNSSKETIESEISQLESELKNLPMFDPSLTERIEILKKDIKQVEEQKIFLEKKVSEFETRKLSNLEISNKINSLDQCPTCDQDVDENHKNKVSQEKTKVIEDLDKELRAIKANLSENRMASSQKREELEKVQKNLQNQNIVQIKTREVESKKQLLVQNKTSNDKINLELISIQDTITSLESKFVDNPQIEIEIQKLKQERDLLNSQLRELEIKKASTESESKTLISVIQRLEAEIASKNRTKDNIAKLIQLREWLEKQFINMTVLMEKSIMLRVHSELESLIQRWFSTLVDSETIKIRLDEEFTPVIDQNGHETDYIHLSGGEKTAAALSYRLALNQVINTLMTTIKTKDLLMLDEPTDGFSQEQLSRMRNILEDLNTKQTIIVSHDPVIESFVDTVIKLEKNDHITKIPDNHF